MIFLKEFIARMIFAILINIPYSFIFMIITYFVEKIKQKDEIPNIEKISFDTIFIVNYILILIILIFFVRDLLW